MKNLNFRKFLPWGLWIAGALLAGATAWGADSIFRIAGRPVAFYHDPVRRLTLSKDCVRPGGLLACAAYSALGRVSLRGARLRGGENPGAVICRRQLNELVVIGTDARGNQNSFCRFADGSLVSNGTLMYFAAKRDGR